MDVLPLLILGLIFMGVWGTMIVSARVKQMSQGTRGPRDDRLLEDMLEANRLLEARLERIEEEMAFYRELRAPDLRGELPPPPGPDSGSMDDPS